MLTASAQRLLVTTGFALAVAAAPVVMAVASVPATSTSPVACAAGEEEDAFTGDCSPSLAPHTGGTMQGPDYSANFSQPISPINGANPDIPEIDGIPCLGNNSGQCIGLAENG